MNRHRLGYELRGLFLGRPVRPFHLAVALATGAVGVLTWHGATSVDQSSVYDFQSHATAVVMMLSACLLTVGWWWRNEWCAEWGLLLATGAWVSRAVYISIAGTGFLGYVEAPAFVSVVAAIVSAALAIGSGGAYLLERYDREVDGEYLR